MPKCSNNTALACFSGLSNQGNKLLQAKQHEWCIKLGLACGSDESCVLRPSFINPIGNHTTHKPEKHKGSKSQQRTAEQIKAKQSKTKQTRAPERFNHAPQTPSNGFPNAPQHALGALLAARGGLGRFGALLILSWGALGELRPPKWYQHGFFLV